ncbi:hypothetical protein Hbl1158_16925 (plasmid) [Halobaculum sp. CBA1158]|uniref:hypothetical protein n=1 Tax=Halobaculum sp. CBA1158 TaxID=2904243 RepID=UPI001F3716B6|nr:hypothetical protein [Halobaculum sp. CBA1158]UIP01738.1 hypothetical protein Hbl1158_16925 [Halobaculum sp. CBA1158]
MSSDVVDHVADAGATVGIGAATAGMGIAWMGSLVQSHVSCGGALEPDVCSALATGEAASTALLGLGTVAFLAMFAAAHLQDDDDTAAVAGD